MFPARWIHTDRVSLVCLSLLERASLSKQEELREEARELQRYILEKNDEVDGRDISVVVEFVAGKITDSIVRTQTCCLISRTGTAQRVVRITAGLATELTSLLSSPLPDASHRALPSRLAHRRNEGLAREARRLGSRSRRTRHGIRLAILHLALVRPRRGRPSREQGQEVDGQATEGGQEELRQAHGRRRRDESDAI